MKEESREPTLEEIHKLMKENNMDFYNAREKTYGGKPPTGYSSWGDYWKSY